MTKAILFDLDNTLIDFMRMKRIACGAAVDAMIKSGLKADKKRTLAIVFKLYDTYGYEYRQVFQALLKEMTGKVDYGIVAAGIVAYRKAREGLLYPYPDVLPTLRKLKCKGIKLAIVTDAPRIEAWIRLAAMKIENKFDVVVTYDDSRAKKPSLRPFQLALKKLRVSPHEALVVGDSIRKDVIPATRLGMTAAYAEYGAIRKEKGHAPIRIRKFKDILRCV